MNKDIIDGIIEIKNPGTETKFDSITVSIEGVVSLQISNKTVGLFEALSNSVKVTFSLFYRCNINHIYTCLALSIV